MTYEQILKFVNKAKEYKSSLDGKSNKLTYAIDKMAKFNQYGQMESGRLKDGLTEYDEICGDERIDHASVDDKGNLILSDKGQYSYKPEKLKALNKKIKEIGLREAKTFEPYFATEVPELDEDFTEAFKGFVIK
jgi:hypothetical protein